MNDEKKTSFKELLEKHKLLTGVKKEQIEQPVSIHTKHISLSSQKMNELAAKFDSFRCFVLKDLLDMKDDIRNITGGSSARIGEVSLKAIDWKGTASPYSQVVSVPGVTVNSQVDLTPSVEQLAIFYEKDLTFVTENEDGVVTVYAIGQKPQNDYTIQVTITEVIVNG